jgi:hypothetical protein
LDNSESIDKLSIEEKKNYVSRGDYISNIEACRLLCILFTKRAVNKLHVMNDSGYLRLIKISYNCFYNREDLYNLIKEAESFYDEHYTREEALKLISMTNFKKLIAIKVPSKYVSISKKQAFVYNKNDIMEFISLPGKIKNETQVDYNLEDYMNREELIKYLEMPTSEIKQSASTNILREEWNVRIVTVRKRILFNKEDIKRVKEETDRFYNSHYSVKETAKLVGEFYTMYHKGMRIPRKYYSFLSMTYNLNLINKVVYSKEEIDYIVKEQNKSSKLIRDKLYISNNPARKILNLSPPIFEKLIKGYEIRQIIYHKSVYYYREDLEKIQEKQSKYFEVYIDHASCTRIYFGGYNSWNDAKVVACHEVPLYAYISSKSKSITAANGCYKILDVEKFVASMNGYVRKSRVNSDLTGRDAFETFKVRLNSYQDWDEFDKESKYTEKKWFDFVNNTLTKTISKESVLSDLINRYVRSTILVKEILIRNNKSEIYLVTASEINLFFRTIDSKMRAIDIYNFLRSVDIDIRTIAPTKRSGFKMLEIEHPNDFWVSKETLEDEEKGDVIYDFNVYSKVFQYCTNIELHIVKSMEEIQTNFTATYASSWLYILLHMNNAWRHGDVQGFPELELNDLLEKLKICDIDWFKVNRIDLPVSRAIIFRINQWELKISKTQMRGSFFCSDELAPAIATAIVLLTLFNNRYGIVANEKLMRFETKYNEISNNQVRDFFDEFEMKNFKFYSRKFNKTIMTYLYYMANISGDSKALLYAQKMREHASTSSTLYYIDLNVEEIESLSRQLFSRGEFGFIPALLVQKINGGTLTFQETTEQICAANQIFGDNMKINATVGFLNTVRIDRESVVQMISEKSLEECQMLLTDIFTRKLPSKNGTDIQCIYSKLGCQRTDLNSCFECSYHIPTIYVLSRLCDSILDDMDMYLSTINKANKFKLSLRISRKKIVVLEAIKKFGKDYVYGCIGMPREDFIERLALIDNPI